MSDSNLSKVLYHQMNTPLERCCWWTEPAHEQAMVEYYKTALSNYDCENPRTFKSVLNAISVVVLPSLCRVTFNFVIMYFIFFKFFKI